MNHRPRNSPSPNRPLRVLLVEHDPTIRHALTWVLRHEGHHVSMAGTGHGALIMLLTQPDLIVIDLSLPDLDGLQTCRQIRARGNLVPILLLTPDADTDDPAAAREAGADGYLVKPVNIPDLLGRLHALRGDRGPGTSHPTPTQPTAGREPDDHLLTTARVQDAAAALAGAPIPARDRS